MREVQQSCVGCVQVPAQQLQSESDPPASRVDRRQPSAVRVPRNEGCPLASQAADLPAHMVGALCVDVLGKDAAAAASDAAQPARASTPPPVQQQQEQQGHEKTKGVVSLHLINSLNHPLNSPNPTAQSQTHPAWHNSQQAQQTKPDVQPACQQSEEGFTEQSEGDSPCKHRASYQHHPLS